jgi:hypothetical protein
MSNRPTVASALARADEAHLKLDGHERLCAERYKNLDEKMDAVTGAIKSHQKIAWGIVVALVGWMAVQLWNGQVTHPANPPAAVIGTGP